MIIRTIKSGNSLRYEFSIFIKYNNKKLLRKKKYEKLFKKD